MRTGGNERSTQWELAGPFLAEAKTNCPSPRTLTKEEGGWLQLYRSKGGRRVTPMQLGGYQQRLS